MTRYLGQSLITMPGKLESAGMNTMPVGNGVEAERKAVMDAGKVLEVVMLAERKAAAEAHTIMILTKHTTTMKARKKWWKIMIK